MNNSRRNVKEPFEWNVSPSANINSSAKAEILEIQKRQENKEPVKDEFIFTEPRVNDSSVSEIAFCVSLDDDDVNLHVENHAVMKTQKQKSWPNQLSSFIFIDYSESNFLYVDA